jgi:hypothetical protein
MLHRRLLSLSRHGGTATGIEGRIFLMSARILAAAVAHAGIRYQEMDGFISVLKASGPIFRLQDTQNSDLLDPFLICI